MHSFTPNCAQAWLSGFENGDMVSGYTGRDYAVTVRHSTNTNRHLLAHNSTVDANGVISRGAVIADLGLFDSTARPWYSTGSACGRYNNSRYGKTCITGVYLDAPTGQSVITLVQPFYSENFTLLGELTWAARIVCLIVMLLLCRSLGDRSSLLTTS